MPHGMTQQISKVQETPHDVVNHTMPTHSNGAIEALLTNLDINNQRFRVAAAFGTPNVAHYLSDQLPILRQLEPLDEVLFENYHRITNEMIAPYRD